VKVIISVLFCILVPIGTYAQDAGKNFIKGLKGTDSLSVGRVTIASMVAPGYAQAYNKQHWKLPIIYGSGAAFVYGGMHSKSLYKETGLNKYKTQSNFYYAGVGLVYLGSIIDGLAGYKTSEKLPQKATLLSSFMPGLGQAYNGDYWKIPIIYGGFTFFAYWLDVNSMQYTRYRRAYNLEYEYSFDNQKTPSEFHGQLSPESIKNYRDRFRRDRDYAVLYMALWYALNVVDATVFAHLSNFDVSENLSMNVSPTIMQTGLYAGGMPGLGLNMSIKMRK